MASSLQSNPKAGRVDIHHHIFPDSIGKAGLSVKVGWQTPPENLPWTPELSIKAMDRMGIRMAILSLPAGIPAGPVGQGNRAAAREFNLYAAQTCADHPGRFAFFACVPNLLDVQGEWPGCSLLPRSGQFRLLHPSHAIRGGALDEIRFALGELQGCGVALSSSYGEGAEAKYVGDDVFDPIWEELERREAVVFLHGAQVPSSTPYPHPYLGIPVTEVPNETFKAAAHLVVTGKKRRWSNVKIVLAHFGGSTPFLAPRVAVLSRHMGCPLTPEEVLADFKSFYYDTALSSHETTLSAMKAFVGDDHVLFGSDFPAVSVEMVEWFTQEADSFYAGDQHLLEAVMHRNAETLLRL